jgi:beta-lactamase superfamily II metal-dependent hydrolase
MRRLIIAAGAALMLAVPIAARQNGTAAGTLTIYFIDVEGGQATLIVTPAGESFLIDTGFPGDGTFSSKPGDSSNARDAQRVMAAARDAGVKQIDYLLLTHYHADHAGGVVELAQLLPIKTFIDHSAPHADADKAVAGTQAVYDAYLALRAKGTHIEPKPGDHLPLKGVDAVIVATAGDAIAKPLAGAGQANAACAGTGIPASETTENPRSTAVRLEFGKFGFLDVGDLTGPPLFALTCPANLIGESDVYLIAHHGGNDAADPALYRAVRPLVAIFNNGPRKGAQADTLATISRFPSIDGWQLHRTLNDDAENVADARIANLDETTSAWLKISAKDDGSFTVTNGRTGYVKTYKWQVASGK